MESYTHRQIYEELTNARHPVFISDERTDGDSLGASLALVDYMLQRGVWVPLYVSEPLPEKYAFLPHTDHCTYDPAVFEDDQIDLVVVFDCSDAEYVHRLMNRIPGNPKLINIDHHATNTKYGTINQVVVEAPATAEVVYQFFRGNHLVISREAATCLLAGICFDTTVFGNSATNERAFTAASELILVGARISDVLRMLFFNRSVDVLRIWGIALERLRKHPKTGTVSTYLTLKDIKRHQVQSNEIDGLSDFLNLVIDADTLFVFQETNDGGVKVSMRSQTQDVSKLAKAFGGGGHKKAAGFTVPNARLMNKDGRYRVVEQGKAS